MPRCDRASGRIKRSWRAPICRCPDRPAIPDRCVNTTDFPPRRTALTASADDPAPSPPAPTHKTKPQTRDVSAPPPSQKQPRRTGSKPVRLANSPIGTGSNRRIRLPKALGPVFLWLTGWPTRIIGSRPGGGLGRMPSPVRHPGTPLIMLLPGPGTTAGRHAQSS